MGEKKKKRCYRRRKLLALCHGGVIHPHTCPVASSPLPQRSGGFLQGPGTTEIPAPHKNLLAKEKPRGTVCLFNFLISFFPLKLHSKNFLI